MRLVEASGSRLVDLPPSLRRGAVLQQLLRHEERSCWAGASSPYVGRSQDRSVNSGKNKQLQTYDPVYAGKQIADQGNAGWGAPEPSQGKQGAGRVQPANQGQPPRYLAPIPPRPRRGAGYDEQPANRYDDGYSAMERAGYTRYRDLASEGALGARLGTRQLPAHDVHNKIGRASCRERVYVLV